MAICNQKIKANIQPNCADPIVGGYRSKAWIFNYNDVTATKSKTSNRVDEILVSPKGFALQQLGDQPFKTNKVLAKGANYNRWNVSVNLVGLEFSAKFYDEVVRSLASGNKVVVVLEHEDERAHDEVFEIFGLDKGLTIADGSGREEYNADTDGGYTLNLMESGAAVPSYWLANEGDIPKADLRKYLDGLITE